MRKVVIWVVALLALMVMVVSAVPAMAADNTTPPAADGPGKGQLVKRLLRIQDEARVDELLARAVAAGRITQNQAERIKAAWEKHYEKAGRRIALGRLMRLQDEARVDELLAQAVADGKITADQAAKIKQAWENRHSK